jgi:hemerythrin-like domain-containing protein
MDALDLLEQQHRDVRELLERLAAQADVASSQETIDEVIRAVEAHVRIEEAYVYIACASKLRGEERAVQASDERAELLATLRVLRATPLSDPQFTTHLTAMTESFERHADMEEDAVFPKLKRTLTDEALDVLGEALAHAHERLLGEDKPWLELDPVRVSRRSARTVREPMTRRCTIVRSGVRPKIRPPTFG